MDDLLLVGQEKGVPGHPSCPSSPTFTIDLVPFSRLEAVPCAAAERPAQKAHHLPDPRDEELRVVSVKTVPHSRGCSRGPASAAVASSTLSSPGRGVTQQARRRLQGCRSVLRLDVGSSGGLQPHTNESNTDRPRRRQPVDFQSFGPVVNGRTLSRKYRQPSSSPCPVLSRAPASCFARCCAPTPKSRRNPVRRSAMGTPESHGAVEGGGKTCHLWTGADYYSHRRTETSLPHR